jgi:hypothetical protein
MIREHHRPLLPEERPRIERSLRRARFGGLLLPLGRFFGLMALWLMGLVIANAAAAWTAPGAGEPADGTVLLALQIGVTLVVLGVGIPVLIRSTRRALLGRRANIALYSQILKSGQLPVIEVETTRVVRFIDNLELGDSFLCEVEPCKCLFLIGGPDEEIIRHGTFPTRTFEVVSLGRGEFDTHIRPTSEVVEPEESLSVKEIHWPDWEHAELLEQSLDDCMSQLCRDHRKAALS